jgi:AcrR family transcriptional regulator
MDEISETAGVAKGTLYYHFNSKEEIFNFIVEQGMKEIEDRVEEKTKHMSDSTEKLRAAFRVQFQLAMEYIDFFKTLFSQMWGDEQRHIRMRQILVRYFSFIEGYIKEALGEESLNDSTMEFVAYNFFGMVISAVVYGMVNEKHAINELTDKFVEFLMKSIK